MAFEGLSDKLENAFKRLRSKGSLTEADVRDAMREVRLALLEADVNYKVAKDFTNKVTERAIGAQVMESLTPAQMVIKIVNEELIELMGGTRTRLNTAPHPPTIVMMCGLQGAGKTTHCAKLALMLKNQGSRPLLAACDIYRPAAIKQLQVVGEQAGVPVFEMGQIDPVTIAKEAIKYAKDHGHDYVFLDTAGRLHVDEALMQELRDVRDTDAGILDIAVQYGFSSNEAFTHAFKKAYGVSPSAYRAAPGPVVLQTILRPFDCYLMEGANHMNETQNAGEVQTYFVHIPAHKFLHIRNYESIGYWDFWQRQSAIPGQDCETICGLLASIPGKLDDAGGTGEDAGSGQLMAWINEPTGRICSWGIPLAEAYGVRLSADYAGPVPAQMQLMDVPAGEYLVFEHGPFDFEMQNAAVEAKIEQVMRDFDYAASGWQLDLTPGRVFYFYHDCARFFKYVRPVCRA